MDKEEPVRLQKHKQRYKDVKVHSVRGECEYTKGMKREGGSAERLGQNGN